MKIFKWVYLKNFFVNIVVFFFMSIVITYICEKIPKEMYSYKNWLLRERKWEKRGVIYQRLLKVKSWKKYLIELNDFIKSVFPKKHIPEYSKEYLSRYLMECCKSELTHWMIIFSTFLFWVFNDFNTFFTMLLVAVALNLPYIIIQRYNRPRILQIIKHMDNVTQFCAVNER